ncbi:MAG: dual specificity protein kinase kns1 [Vezdaea aestivalis]|nr:MAG: dual specificity protein kinase kns1 [Vezdaea aestivalis]
MSTPSTATAILPLPHHNYRFSQHHDYHVRDSRPASAFNAASLLHPHPQPRLEAPINYHSSANATTVLPLSHSLQPQSPSHLYYHAQQLDSPTSASSAMASRKRQRGPNWEDFYKNGLPKEVIVIDDDSPQPPENSHLVSRPTHMMRQNDSKRAGQTQRGEPAAKKRRTGATNGYASSVAQSHSYQVSHQEESLSDSTRSTGRTESALHTTAATSLGSHYSQNAAPSNSHSYQPTKKVDTVVVKKRRTRQTAADEAKKLEAERSGDAFAAYIPPPRPPIKAKDVDVPLAHDTSPYKNQKVDDDDGHYMVVNDTDITSRYSISRLLGQGTFGKVVEAVDKHRNSRVAIKIIRSVQKYRDASRIELRVLATLNHNDRDNRNKCIHLRDCFDFRNHICIVTDLLGMSVFDFLKSNQFVPFPSSQIQNFARQLLTSVAFLHDLNLIHTDLKPENILLVHNHYQTFTYGRQVPTSTHSTSRVSKNRKVLLDTDIRLIDFGSATFDDEYHSSVVSTRHYRAPEIILGLGWSFPCDIWSIGCILVEFFTGDALFQTHDNLEHLAMMESVCGGKIEARLIKQVVNPGRGHQQNSAAKYFVSNRRLDYPNKETTRASKKYVNAMKPLANIIPTNPNNRFNECFLDLLKRIFLYDPAKRITAKEALKHPWFKEHITDDGTEATKIRLQRQRDGQLHGRGFGEATTLT